MRKKGNAVGKKALCGKGVVRSSRRDVIQTRCVHWAKEEEKDVARRINASITGDMATLTKEMRKRLNAEKTFKTTLKPVYLKCVYVGWHGSSRGWACRRVSG
jgi:hypothetical protein